MVVVMNATSLVQPAPQRLADVAPPRVEIVVPVFNEERVLGESIRRLSAFLEREMPVSWGIVIADNASTDATPFDRRRACSSRSTGSRVLRLDEKGRGRALRAAWLASEAEVVAYMDVDLSTDLRALAPLAAPLLSGHSDVAIGTRLGHGARVMRGPRREFISRAYNRLLRGSAGRPLLRRPVRLQGRPRRGGPQAAARGPRRGLVLRHRAADPRPARGAADPRGAGRLGRRPRLARGRRQHRAR